MKIMVLYYSRTGNTKKLAEYVCKGVNNIEGVEGYLKNPSNVCKQDFISSKGIICGSPVYFGSMASDLKKVFDDFVKLRSEMEGKVGGAFATSMDASGGKETTVISIIQAMLIYGMVIVGDPLDASGHYGVSCQGLPDDKTCEDAIKFGGRIGRITKKLHK